MSEPITPQELRLMAERHLTDWEQHGFSPAECGVVFRSFFERIEEMNRLNWQLTNQISELSRQLGNLEGREKACECQQERLEQLERFAAANNPQWVLFQRRERDAQKEKDA